MSPMTSTTCTRPASFIPTIFSRVKATASIEAINLISIEVKSDAKAAIHIRANALLSERENQLRFRVAGETLCFADIEKFLVTAHPKMLKDLLQITEAESIINASIGKFVSRDAVKMAMAVLFVCLGLGILFILLKNAGVI